MKLKLDSPNPTDNFKAVEDTIRKSPFLKADFVIREYVMNAAGTDVPVAHGLSFVPKDFIITRGSATIGSKDPDGTFVYLDVTAPTTVRIAIGKWSQ